MIDPEMGSSEVSPVDDLYDHAPCGLLVTTRDDLITRVNATFLEWTGYAREDVIGIDFHALLDHGGQAFYATRYQQELWARREMREVAFTLVGKDGASLPILVNAQLVSTESGASSEVRLAVFDSTLRHDYEREMLSAKRHAETSEASVRALQEASALFQSAATEDDLASLLSHAARDAFAAFAATVVMYDGGGRFHAAAGEGHEGWLIQLADALPSRSAALGSGIVVVSSLDEAYRESRAAGDLMRSHRTEALTAVEIADGDRVLGVLVCLFGRPREFDAAARELHAALVRQASPVLSRLRLQQELEQRALHDQLTGLANRTLLAERITLALSASRRTGKPMAVIFVDLDGFKLINDDLGHRVGDHVLFTAATRMSTVVRVEDTVGRFGGDEFVVVCEDADEAEAAVIADRLSREIRHAIDGVPARFRLTASIGVAVFDPHQAAIPNQDSLILLADEAMYRSKRSGRDQVTIVRVPEPRPDGETLESRIIGAASRGELMAVFQPQVDLTSGEVIAVEGLCRWNEPSRGLIEPEIFVPLAEQSDAILEIGAFMLNEGCALLDRLQRAGIPLDVSINVSPRQLGAHQLVEEITFQTERYGLDARRLTLEITESREIFDLGESVAELATLRGLGVGISIDDFGTGYSSEEQVRQLPVTELKIDRSVVQATGIAADRALVEIIELARAQNARVVAEGVETAEQNARARALGCDRAQGYLHGRPSTADHLESLLSRA